jgi:hypothetical protein
VGKRGKINLKVNPNKIQYFKIDSLIKAQKRVREKLIENKLDRKKYNPKYRKTNAGKIIEK